MQSIFEIDFKYYIIYEVREPAETPPPYIYVITLKVGLGQSSFSPPSASSGRGRVFGFQALFEAAKQNPVLFVLLLFLSVELPLDLEAAVHDEGRAQHREPESSHMQLARLDNKTETPEGRC